MKKTLLSIALFCASFASNAQCTAVATLNENFENFVAGVLPQNCWTSNSVSPRLTIDTVNGNKVLQAYTFMNPASPIYIVTPELTVIDGNLTYDIGTPSAPGTLKIQVGTMVTPTDYGNITNVGAEITVAAASTQSIVIPPSTTHKYIVFKITSTAPHSVSSIDNVVYESNLSVGEKEIATFSVYPNPSIDRNVNISYDNATGNEKNSVAIYSLTGAKVFETKLQNNSGSNTINLSDLSSGVYIMKLQSGDYTTTKKLVLK